MLFKKLFDGEFETTAMGASLQPVRVKALPAELTDPASANDRERVLARRAWRRQRLARGAGGAIGGWALRAW